MTENDVESIDDIIETMETIEDVRGLAEEMKLESDLETQFVDAVMRLNDIRLIPDPGVHLVDPLRCLPIDKPNKTIMVIGETGTGKTTLLNSMMNYLWNVQYHDPYRYKLIDEGDKEKHQSQSVTNDVTAYHLAPPALDYELTVIDTPGFNDTRGFVRDQKITKQNTGCCSFRRW